MCQTQGATLATVPSHIEQGTNTHTHTNLLCMKSQLLSKVQLLKHSDYFKTASHHVQAVSVHFCIALYPNSHRVKYTHLYKEVRWLASSCDTKHAYDVEITCVDFLNAQDSFLYMIMVWMQSKCYLEYWYIIYYIDLSVTERSERIWDYFTASEICDVKIFLILGSVAFLVTLLPNSSFHLWLGLTSDSQGHFKWAEPGLLSYTNWGPGEPVNNSGQNKNPVWKIYIYMSCA